jgi:hypothetical protein
MPSAATRLPSCEGLGVIYERISWNDRFFIPTDKPEVLGSILKTKPLVTLKDPAGGKPLERRVNAQAGMPAADVEAQVAGITSQWENAPPIRVVQRSEDLPFPDEGLAAGSFDPTTGTVYLVADNLSPRDVARTVMHEAVGHFGLRATFGGDLVGVLDRLAVARAAEVRAKAVEYGKDFGDEEGRRIAAEEVLAAMAESQPELGWVKKAVAAIRSWLRGHVPGFGSLSVTDDEIIRDYILPAQRAVFEGKTGPTQQWNDAPMASLLRNAMNSTRDAALPAGYIVNDLINNNTEATGKLSWWHKTVGTPFNLARRSELFRRSYDAVQRFLADVNHYAADAAKLAPTLLPTLEHIRDLKKQPISAADSKALFQPIFHGTLIWTRDENGAPVKVKDFKTRIEATPTADLAQILVRAGHVTQRELADWKKRGNKVYESSVRNLFAARYFRPGIVWTRDELTSQFKMTKEQADLYFEARKALDRSLSTLAISQMVRLGGEDVAALRERAMESTDAQAVGTMLAEYLTEEADRTPERKKVLLATAERVLQMADKEKDLRDKGYAPLMRFGHHTVYVEGKDHEPLFFGMYETAREAAKAAREMTEAFSDNPDAKVSRGTNTELAYQQFAGVTPETLAIFGEIMGLDETGNSKADQLFQMYLKMTKNSRSALTRLIHRKGIAGYSEDTARVLAGFIYSNARHTSSGLHMQEMDDSIEAIPIGQGEIKDRAISLVDYVKHPQEEAAGVRGLLFTQYLGGSIASALINATQPFAVTFPFLSQFGGVRAAGRQMKAAMSLLRKEGKDGTTGDTRLDTALKKASEEGTVSPQEIHQLIAQGQGRASLKSGDGTKAGDLAAAASNKFAKGMFIWGKVFSLAEQFNRRLTFIAAYRLAEAQGIGDPEGFAKRAVDETQFVYNRGNKPQWAKGAIGSTCSPSSSTALATSSCWRAWRRVGRRVARPRSWPWVCSS